MSVIRDQPGEGGTADMEAYCPVIQKAVPSSSAAAGLDRTSSGASTGVVYVSSETIMKAGSKLLCVLKPMAR
jgi:hypothetical protein